ncbi:MAG: sterol desaturase family protein [Thermodesulfobacteriota bacterium]
MTSSLLATSGLVAAGFLAWSFLEYLIHGLLSHRWRTFAGPLHLEHHRDPRRVFTSVLVWLPAASLLFVLLALAVGRHAAGALALGTLAGFLRHEHVHWRIHFRRPRSARHELLRRHHLAHHFRNPEAYHGVTTRFWDRVFGTLPASHAEDYARVAHHPPLEGRSNLGALRPRRAARTSTGGADGGRFLRQVVQPARLHDGPPDRR